jgi:protease-4
MSSLDNLSALIYLKNKATKWKNISILLIILSVLFFIKSNAKDSLSNNSLHSASDYIASITIDGIIFENDHRSIVLKKILEEDSIKAVIVNIDSPGGGIVGSEILFEELRKISEKKPIVAVMGSVAASGGYMAAIASDYIIARNGTITGSIGVLMESPDLTNLTDKIGIKFNHYKSSPIKGSPNPFEKTNSKIDKIINDSVMDSFYFFADLVKERRGKKLKGNLSEIFDGRIFTGRQAVKVGVIDEIGGIDQAILYLNKNHNIKKDLEIKKIDLVKKEDSFFLKEIFGSLINTDHNFIKSQNRIMSILK